MVISVMCPTRKRPDALLQSIKSLVSTISNDNTLEILLAFDSDDRCSSEKFKACISSEFPSLVCKYYEMEPLGYSKLHHYYNFLMKEASGKWVLLWNDDAIMETSLWDKVVESFADRFVLIATKCSTPGFEEHPGCMFPVIPKKWIEVVGRISDDCHNDSWLERASQRSGVYEVADIFVFHDHPMKTGNNKDETYSNGVAAANNLEHFYSRDGDMTDDANKILAYLENLRGEI